MPNAPRQPYDPGPEYRQQKRAAGCCINYRCQAKAGKHSGGRCYKHRWQDFKRRDLVAYIYWHKRGRAMERGKRQPWGRDGWGPWTLTLENFRQLCAWTGYHTKTGRTASALSLDRKDNRFGYHIWNLQFISLSANSTKGTRYQPELAGYHTDAQGLTTYRDEDGNEYPF